MDSLTDLIQQLDFMEMHWGEPENQYLAKELIDEAITGLEKLADYEDAEEQGLLLRLPCKVGDTAWYVHRNGIDEVVIDSFIVNVNIFANVSYYIGCERFGKTLTPYKTLFFTREEAESALAEKGGVE